MSATFDCCSILVAPVTSVLGQGQGTCSHLVSTKWSPSAPRRGRVRKQRTPTGPYRWSAGGERFLGRLGTFEKPLKRQVYFENWVAL